METKAQSDTKPTATEPEIDVKQLWKSALELGPLVIFFAVNSWAKIFVATGAFMVATLVALALYYRFFGRVPLMPLITGGLVLIFGGLTIWLQNDLFIKMKVTFVYSMFAAVLLGGLLTGRTLLKYVLGEAFKITDEGWKILTLRWGLFFIFLAVLNEIVWRNYSTDTWLSIKTFGFTPILMVFAVAQIGVINRYKLTST